MRGPHRRHPYEDRCSGASGDAAHLAKRQNGQTAKRQNKPNEGKRNATNALHAIVGATLVVTPVAGHSPALPETRAPMGRPRGAPATDGLVLANGPSRMSAKQQNGERRNEPNEGKRNATNALHAIEGRPCRGRPLWSWLDTHRRCGARPPGAPYDGSHPSPRRAGWQNKPNERKCNALNALLARPRSSP